MKESILPPFKRTVENLLRENFEKSLPVKAHEIASGNVGISLTKWSDFTNHVKILLIFFNLEYLDSNGHLGSFLFSRIAYYLIQICSISSANKVHIDGYIKMKSLVIKSFLPLLTLAGQIIRMRHMMIFDMGRTIQFSVYA